MRLGIIGVGRIGALHAETLHALAEVDELVITDADTARARQLASQMDVAWAEDSDELLHGGTDGIVIATPTGTHAPLICAAVEAGVAVFCEKPVDGFLRFTGGSGNVRRKNHVVQAEVG